MFDYVVRTEIYIDLQEADQTTVKDARGTAHMLRIPAAAQEDILNSHTV